MPITIEQVIDAWNLTEDLNYSTAGLSDPGAFSEAERLLGFALPSDVRTLYSAFDGGEFIGGNLRLFPLLPRFAGDLGLTTASNLYRDWQWTVPPKLAIFGGDGSDGSYGLWFDEHSVASPMVVEIAEGGDDADLAIVGDSLAGFLAGHSAYHLLSFGMDEENTEPALDALKVPEAIRASFTGTDDDYHRLLNWANPNLPDKTPDPYGRGMTREQINEIAQSRR